MRNGRENSLEYFAVAAITSESNMSHVASTVANNGGDLLSMGFGGDAEKSVQARGAHPPPLLRYEERDTRRIYGEGGFARSRKCSAKDFGDSSEMDGEDPTEKFFGKAVNATGRRHGGRRGERKRRMTVAL